MHQSQQLPYNPDDLLSKFAKEAIKAEMVKKEEEEHRNKI